MAPPYGDPELGARLREIRVRQGLALKVVAKRAEISPPYLSEVERGRKLPALNVLVRIAEALGTTAVEVLRGLSRYERPQG